MIDKKQTIALLISQHRGLETDLTNVSNDLNQPSVVAEKILSGLLKFKTDLLAHLKIENEVFYRQLLIDLKDNGQDIQATQKFIDEMDAIAVAVTDFLTKFSTQEAISAQLTALKTELPLIINTLALRIESEENGVYAYWQ